MDEFEKPLKSSKQYKSRANKNYDDSDSQYCNSDPEDQSDRPRNNINYLKS